MALFFQHSQGLSCGRSRPVWSGCVSLWAGTSRISVGKWYGWVGEYLIIYIGLFLGRFLLFIAPDVRSFIGKTVVTVGVLGIKGTGDFGVSVVYGL